jgi:hypothetical protein
LARPFTTAERKNIQALIHYQAHKTGLRPRVIDQAAECFLKVDHLSELTAEQYDVAIRFLVDFQGVN